jgi:hypothetical protein
LDRQVRPTHDNENVEGFAMIEDTHGAENNRNPGRRLPHETAASIWTAGWRLAYRQGETNRPETGRLRTANGAALPVQTTFAAEQTGWRHMLGIPADRRILSEA